VSRILRELEALQEREGWLPEAGLREIASRLGVPLHRLEGLSTFYTHFRREPVGALEVSLCRDVTCRLAGATAVQAELRANLEKEGVAFREVSCLGRCDRAPAGCVGHRAVDLGDEGEVRAALADPEPAQRPQRSWAAEPFPTPAKRHAALRSLLAEDPGSLSQRLEEAGLRGMGGAGFPTGRKWGLVASEPATPKHVICNADESEPSTFKDREILHDLPHLVIEGMLLAAHCVGASHGTIFIRHEYEAERRRLEAALHAARQAGLLGRGVLGSALDFDIEIFVSPGGYILGEETALLECLEDRRGEPRNKPPFPGQRGLHGRPTLINNVETFAHAVGILTRGVEWWRSLGRGEFSGHKFMAVSGDVAAPGVYLVPFGMTLRELLEEAGGMREGAELLAVSPGGASSLFLAEAALDTPLDFDRIADAGSMLGSGAACFVARGRDLLEVGLDVTRFFRNESCGKCVPCRVGTEKAVGWMEERPCTPELVAELRELHHTLERTSICGLGQVALAPLLSILERFPDSTAGE